MPLIMLAHGMFAQLQAYLVLVLLDTSRENWPKMLHSTPKCTSYLLHSSGWSQLITEDHSLIVTLIATSCLLFLSLLLLLLSFPSSFGINKVLD